MAEKKKDTSTKTKLPEVSSEKKKGNFLNVLINNRFVLIGFALGLVVGLAIMSTRIPEQIANLKDGSESIAVFKEGGVSANELYTKLKGNANITVILDLIDSKLLESKYPYEKYKQEAKEQADEEMKYLAENDVSVEQFLSYYGFDNYDSFIEYLTLDSQKRDYYHDTLASSISSSDKKRFYKKKVYGTIGAKMISVQVNDNSNDDEKLIKELQTKVNNGSTYDELVAAYKDNSNFKYADLGYIAFNSGIDSNLETAIKKLKNNSHMTKYIKTETYGYVIAFRTNQKEKESYEDLEDDILEFLISEKDKKDPNLYFKTFIDLRKKSGLKFTDTNFGKLYNEYIKQYK